MSGILKVLQAAQDKRSASSRMTNVVCSTAVFPDEFEVSAWMMKKGTELRQPASPLANASTLVKDMSPTNSCRSDETSQELLQSQTLTSTEHNQVVLQVQWNVEMMKLKLLNLFEVAPVPFEEENELLRIQALQESATVNSDSQNEATRSRPSSGTKRQSASTRASQHACIAIDGIFRFAFEEISLRWHGLQERPFSLRAFHQVAKEQIVLRDLAQAASTQEKAKRLQLEAEVRELMFKVDSDTRQHDDNVKVLLTENRVLRQRIMDLQLKLKVDEPVPQLFDARAPQVTTQGAFDDNQIQIDANEKHYETLNRRLTEECMLLAHTLEQRNVIVKTLSSELSASKQLASSVKEDFRRFVNDQESADSDFRKLFTQNEQATIVAKHECSEAIARASEAESRMTYLAGEVEGLETKINSLDLERESALAERDHLRGRNNELLFEAERAREELEVANEAAAKEARELKMLLETARNRIVELENDGTRAKLDVALAENSALQEKVKTLQRAVESRDRQIVSIKADHKQEVGKLEETISSCRSEFESAKVKFEDLLKREHQKGLELAAKKVSEASEKFDEERQQFRAAIHNTERTITDLTHEVMLFHRQSTILEKFLKNHCAKDELRTLAKMLLKRDLRNTILQLGGESDGEANQNTVTGDGEHTPRTRLYFGMQRAFHPEDVQLRLTMASDHQGGEPLHFSQAIVLKSTITEDFIAALSKHEPGDALPDFTTQMGKARSPSNVEDKSIFEAPSSMMMDELKSLIVQSKLEVKALKDELFTTHHEIQSLQSAGIQTSFASAHSLAGSARRVIRSAGRSRPSSAVTHRSDDTGCESPTLMSVEGPNSLPTANLSFHGSTPIHQTQSRSTIRRSETNTAPEKNSTDLRTSASNVSAAPFMTENEAPFTMAREFPGLQHAAEFIDLIESFFSLRRQLTSLVNVCVAQAEYGDLHPNDLASVQDLLHTKFTIFRAVESENNTMLHRLHRKKEDLMRHREEELERVLSAMQNIAVTHPKESANLLRVAKTASRSRQAHPIQLVRTLVSEDSGHISAVVVRPRSQQSMHRVTPSPSDVVVSGAAALLSMRSRAASATPHKR